MLLLQLPKKTLIIDNIEYISVFESVKSMYLESYM